MPIKFRCSYCRQFLGIARSRVGSIVDCPTCGRSIRVPGTDGVAAPLPAPELDREDTHLARALDELAALADAPVNRPAIATADDISDEAEIPQPLPEPEPVELPMPIRMAPATVPEPLSVAEDVDTRADLEALLQPVAVAEVSRPATPLVTPLLLLLLAAIIPASTMAVGIAIGSAMIPRTPVATVPAAVPEPVVASVTVLEGRITYQTADGEVRPDAGAVVIAVPETWEGLLRLSPIGLRPGDAENDQAAAIVMASGFGGGAARTDDAGRYRVAIPTAGRFRVAIFSRFSERADSAPLAGDVRDALASFLADPEATVGRRAVRVTSVTISADKSTALDHGF
ncbi:MAG TPA: hypothetical protein VFG20_17820 [Planctomycetaceae bacterium]|nr:hypothetical protein [Planctomycetaceae bacterium]